jgi:hypothetical protein
MSPDGTALTLGFDQLQIYYGPGYTPSEKSSSCTIIMTLGYPSGHYLALLGSLYHGSALLDAGMTAIARSSYVLTPGHASPNTQATIKGPFTGIYTSNATIPTDASLTLCELEEVKLQINTRITLTSTSSVDLGSLDGEPPFTLQVQQLRLGWLPCPVNSSERR